MKLTSESNSQIITKIQDSPKWALECHNFQLTLGYRWEALLDSQFCGSRALSYILTLGSSSSLLSLDDVGWPVWDEVCADLFLSSGHKLDMPERKEPQRRSCLHQIGPWTHLWEYFLDWFKRTPCALGSGTARQHKKINWASQPAVPSMVSAAVLSSRLWLWIPALITLADEL